MVEWFASGARSIYMLVMRYLLLILVVLVGFAATPHARANQTGIAVVVNEDAISMGDLADRYRLILASSRLPDGPKTRERITPQIISALVEEQLKIQEAVRNDIKVSQSEINNGFATIAQQNGLKPEEFRKALLQSGINVSTMERQIRAQISWSKVVAKRLRPKVNISESDIDTVLKRLHNSVGLSEYLASEIYLPIENPKEEAQVRDLAINLANDMQAGRAPFFRVAQQFSKAPGAPQGGDLGWVQEGQLARELDSVLVRMEPEQISSPIRSLGGYHILLLRQKRTISEDTIPERKQISSGLGMQRLDRLQQRLLLDLKSSAFIENRLVTP